ncbi:MAG: transcriptional activator NhaR [Myxococcota bacterium]
MNYHHLLYFWTVANEGSMTRAAKVLSLAPSTVSEQVNRLEESFEQKLFRREGRKLVLSDVGKVVYQYADEIFTTGRELQDYVRGRATGGPLRLDVGVADVVPKLVAHKLLEPAIGMDQSVMLYCREDHPEVLVKDLVLHRLDVIFTDAPVTPKNDAYVFNHLLGECGVAVFAAPRLAATLDGEFPYCVDGAPFLLPTKDSELRGILQEWFARTGARPKIVAEFEDSALMKVFGQRGVGVFAAPDIVQHEISSQYNVQIIGTIEGAVERFYAVSADRKLDHPAVVAITTAARGELFHLDEQDFDDV